MPEIWTLCEFELGRMMKDLPVVDARLSGTRFSRQSGTWLLEVAFPARTDAGTYEDDVQTGMHCSTFVVELSGNTPDDWPEVAEADAFERILAVARDVADTIWTAQQTQGFAGAAPKIVRHELTVDGVKRHFGLASQHGMGVLFGNLPAVTYDAVREAVEDARRPSTARLLLAQATRWGLADHFASKSAALLLAASACEVAIKSAVSQDPLGRLGTLPKVLDPDGSQAPLSAAALLEHVIPLAVGRSIGAENPGFLKKYKELAKMRNAIVHTGLQIDQQALQPHLNTARRLITWIDARVADAQA